ncbi:hypothetical protein ACFROC_21425 [Nocardia tengchongensis]|uniref:hypothetical protein n=1 Tax=Nocardia tengchongensis TaxID=2055889 RepID=UPI0036AD6246
MPESANADPTPIMEPTWAAPDSLLGLIQRGRGAARAAAAAAPEAAAECVIDCIVHDPRWDHQVEHRAWLYSTLVADLGIDLRHLRAAYTGPVDPSDDADAGLLVDVLERLVRRGIEDQRASDVEPPSRAGLGGRAARDAADRERILHVATESGLIHREATADFDDEGWETVLFEVAETITTDESLPLATRIAVRRQLSRLRSPRALAWARAHAGLHHEIGGLALSMLTDLAEQSDAVRLLEFLVATGAEGHRFIYQQCDLVTALERLDHRPAVPAVEAIADSTVYSYLRKRCARALSRLSADFPRGRAIEYLDDCEDETRGIAIAHVDLSVPGVRERLARTAADTSEDPDNREAARARIS